MTLQLSQKEKMLLQDQKKHEETCVKKYSEYANQAQDPELKQLFNSHAQSEQQHLDSINQLLSGQIPNVQQQGQQQGQGGQSNQQNSQGQMQQSAGTQGMANQNDAYLCTDLLGTEKYVSGTYDTTIFECSDINVRQVLNHIQKEEQEHGEHIFNYMQSHGMYNIQ